MDTRFAAIRFLGFDFLIDHTVNSIDFLVEKKFIGYFSHGSLGAWQVLPM